MIPTTITTIEDTKSKVKLRDLKPMQGFMIPSTEAVYMVMERAQSSNGTDWYTQCMRLTETNQNQHPGVSLSIDSATIVHPMNLIISARHV